MAQRLIRAYPVVRIELQKRGGHRFALVNVVQPGKAQP